ncbi:MAG: triose-phosphate isomerase [Actinomycetota bacterium]|jgi:triosephosphate isomerase|nr:triose-phosphate isomerase [Actinomycetota bacterium]MDD5601002.1 triose-phosphate isomerase [Actinomycetota bacterium]
MYKGFQINPPFFEIGPKAYMYGNEVLELAKAADRISEKYNVQIIFDPQYTDIPVIAKETKNLLVFAQHMDSIPIGKGYGSVLPEAIKAAGAVGAILNHAEKPISLAEINKTIKRADEIGLATMVCTNTIEEAAAVAHLAPNIIVAEEPELIGTGKISNLDKVKKVIEIVHDINPEIYVLEGAGVSSGSDVSSIVKAGFVATGSSSGICKAEDPIAMVEEMISTLRKTWDEINK